MATNETDIPGDLRVLNYLGPEAWGPGFSEETMGILRQAAEKGWIQSSSVLESYIAEKSSLIKTAERGKDFSDGTDAKKCSAAVIKEKNKPDRYRTLKTSPVDLEFSLTLLQFQHVQ